MQRLSLKVLLRFLSTYSHWNLVRRSEGYHLYFVTKDSEGSILRFPGRKAGRQAAQRRRTVNRLRKQEHHVPTLRRAKIKSVEGGKTKDVFIFSPIFETVEEAVQVGIGPVENFIMDEKSKRSSYDSLIWDDYLPYKENDSMDEDSYDTIENSTETDSKESTPFFLDDLNPKLGLIEEKKPHNVSVRNQADKLLKDMLQLRREIEAMNCQARPEDEHTIKSVCAVDVEQQPDQEQQLFDRLEVLTAEMKREMETAAGAENITERMERVPKMNVDDDTKIRNFFKSIVEKKAKIQDDPLSSSPQSEKGSLEPPEVGESAAAPDPLPRDEQQEKEQRELQKRREKRERKRGEKGLKPAYDVDSLKRKTKHKKEDLVDVPFCGYNQHKTGQNLHYFATIERRKKKRELQTVLSPHDKMAAKEILTDLMNIREKNKRKGQEKNIVLDSMISIISLSSMNMSLPVPATNTLQFKDLFDFEVNFCESREVFEKLAMNKTDEIHTLQDLFPWSDIEGGNLNKLQL